MSEATEIPREHELDTSWMDNMAEWGITAKPGKRGLTLADVQLGSYADLPEISDNMTGRPRGLHRARKLIESVPTRYIPFLKYGLKMLNISMRRHCNGSGVRQQIFPGIL